MRGYITEVDFPICEEAFPGIVHYYEALEVKPRTFLELLWDFMNRCDDAEEPAALAAVATPHAHR
jgi:hypothetical protein